MRTRGLVVGMFLSCAIPASASAVAPSATASSPASPRDLHRRCHLLLRLIRAQASASVKNTALLRAKLGELAAENSVASDPKAADRLRLAEENLAKLEAGLPLPPPTSDETDAEELSDASAPAGAEESAPRPPILDQVAFAGAFESGGTVFDGGLGHGGGPAVGAGLPPTASDLSRYLALEDGAPRKAFLLGVSKDLLTRLKLPDEKGERADFMAWRLGDFLSSHPDRRDFAALRLRVDPDETLHLVYILRDGSLIDQTLGKIGEWTTPKYAQKAKAVSAVKKGAAGRGGGKKKSGAPKKPKKDGGDAGGLPSGGSRSGGSKSGGSKNRAGGSRGGRARSRGGRGGDPGAGGVGGDGRAGHRSQAKGRRVRSGRSAGNEPELPPSERAGGPGKGGGPQRKGVAGGAVGASAAARGGRSKLRRTAGRDSGPADPHESSVNGTKARRGTSVPLPKDYVSRGAPSPLGGGKDGARGGGVESGGHQRPKASSSIAKASDGGVRDQGSGPTIPAVPPAAVAGGRTIAAPRPPRTVDVGLRDSVAAHAAVAQGGARTSAHTSPSEPPAEPVSDPSPWPLAAAGTISAAAASLLRLGSSRRGSGQVRKRPDPAPSRG